MKVAIVEKAPTKVSYNKWFNFEYDKYALTKSKKTKINKSDITLDFNVLEDYDYVLLIGAEPSKHIAKVAVTKYAGHLISDKYFPMLNPQAILFNPQLKSTFEKAVKRMTEHMKGTYVSELGEYEGIRCATRAKEYLNQILREESCKYVAIDTETSAFSNREGHPLGIAMSHKEGRGVYIDTDIIDEELEVLFQKVFDNKTMVFWNYKFDAHWMNYHFGWRFPRWHDGMLIHYILDENSPHDLKSVIMKYTNMGDYDAELEEFKKKDARRRGIPIKQYSYMYIPWEIMEKYAGADADATLRLFNKFYPTIENSKTFPKLYHKILKPGLQFLKEIEEIGVPFDIDRVKFVSDKLREDIDIEVAKLYEFPEVKKVEEMQGEKFNPNSPTQLAVLFFDVLKLPIIKKTDTGAPSTDKEVLAELEGMHPVAAHVGKIRGLVKLKSTYADKILREIHNDGRLRTGFHLHTTTSGRLSSSGKLNMQQLPRDDKLIKSCIKSNKEGYVIYSQDLQTAEMYYAAVLSGDKALARVFESGGDFHSTIAHMVFKLPCTIEEVKDKFPQYRQASKAISFGILYGAGPAKVAESCGATVEEAKEYIQAYFGQFPELKKWLKKVQEEIKRDGCIYSVLGRKRRLAGVYSISEGEQGHAVRSGVNFLIQSVASDANLIAAIKLHNWIKETNFPAEIFALVHDSIIGSIREDKVQEWEAKMKEITQENIGVTLKSGHPIGVDFGYGKNYAEAA